MASRSRASSLACVYVSFLVSGVLSEGVLSAPQIPRQIIMTGKPDSLDSMPAEVRRNVENTLKLAGKDMKFMWFGDKKCHDFIKEHFADDDQLLAMFDNADPGFYRGDICRAVVLYELGGFYSDLDVELAMPFDKIVDDNTTFASVFARGGEVFNGLFAAAPKSPIMLEVINQIRKWYNGDQGRKWHYDSYMGTATMFRGMERALNIACDETNLTLKRNVSSWVCGDHVIRMYEEQPLNCNSNRVTKAWPKECPLKRQHSPKYATGMRLGFFPAGQAEFAGRPIMGWPRFAGCISEQDGCGSGGHNFLHPPRLEESSTNTIAGQLMATAGKTMSALAAVKRALFGGSGPSTWLRGDSENPTKAHARAVALARSARSARGSRSARGRSTAAWFSTSRHSKAGGRKTRRSEERSLVSISAAARLHY